MLKTNSKKAKENIKKFIIEDYEAYEGISYSANNYEHICANIWSRFQIEVGSYYKGTQFQAWHEWVQGIPSYFFNLYNWFYYDEAIKFVGNLLEETEEERQRFNRSDAWELGIKLLYKEVSAHASKYAGGGC